MTNCDRLYDWVFCSYQPCNQGFVWVHGSCLLFIEDAEGMPFVEASSFCEFYGATIVIENSQAISDWVKSTIGGEHWIGAKLVNFCPFPFFNILYPLGQCWCTLLDRQFSNELSKLAP